MKVFERRGFEAGQRNAARRSQQQMDQINGHTGPVNGCLFLRRLDLELVDSSTQKQNKAVARASKVAKKKEIENGEPDAEEKEVEEEEETNHNIDDIGEFADESGSETESDYSSESSFDDEVSLSTSSDDDWADFDSSSSSDATNDTKNSGRRKAKKKSSKRRKKGQNRKDADDEDLDADDVFRLLSWSADGTIKVWGMTSGKVLETLTGHGGAVTTVRCCRCCRRYSTYYPDQHNIVPSLWVRTSEAVLLNVFFISTVGIGIGVDVYDRWLSVRMAHCLHHLQLTEQCGCGTLGPRSKRCSCSEDTWTQSTAVASPRTENMCSLWVVTLIVRFTSGVSGTRCILQPKRGQCRQAPTPSCHCCSAK